MNHYAYKIEDDFAVHKVIATNAQDAKRIVKQRTGVPMKYMIIKSKEQIEEYWMMPHNRYEGTCIE